MKKLRTEKGITLIALVITIIVMLILVGVSVTVALNGGLFSTAQKATEDTKAERDNELALSDGKVTINGEEYNSIDEYVKGGSSNNPEEPTGYAVYSVGDTVTIGTENFYVLKDSDATQEKVTLLAKDNIDTTTLLQSASAGKVKFSTENYWGSGTSPYDIVEPEPTLDETTGKLTLPASHTAAKAAYDYGAKLGGTGRLMTHSEATALQTANSDILYGIDGKSSSTYLNYWLGSAYNTDRVWDVDGLDVYLDSSLGYGNGGYCGVRPVVEISKSSIS